MRTVAETQVFVRYAAEVWSDAERQEFINLIAANPEAGDIITGSGVSEGQVVEVGSGQARWRACYLLPHAYWHGVAVDRLREGKVR